MLRFLFLGLFLFGIAYSWLDHLGIIKKSKRDIKLVRHDATPDVKHVISDELPALAIANCSKTEIADMEKRSEKKHLNYMISFTDKAGDATMALREYLSLFNNNYSTASAKPIYFTNYSEENIIFIFSDEIDMYHLIQLFSWSMIKRHLYVKSNSTGKTYLIYEDDGIDCVFGLSADNEYIKVQLPDGIAYYQDASDHSFVQLDLDKIDWPNLKRIDYYFEKLGSFGNPQFEIIEASK